MLIRMHGLEEDEVQTQKLEITATRCVYLTLPNVCLCFTPVMVRSGKTGIA